MAQHSRRRIQPLLTLAGVFLCGAVQPPAPPGERDVALMHAAVVDVAATDPRRAILRDRTVIVSRGRIAGVGRNVPIPRNTRVVNAAGRYVIPGLWDMHVHTLTRAWADAFLPQFVAYGVTGVRDMGTSREELAAAQTWRAEITAGTRPGPRILTAGRVVDGAPSIWPFAVSVAGESDARDAVRALAAERVDFIKVYATLSREAYFALADEARRRRLPLAGHVPERVSPAEASDAGQRSIEHLSNVLFACSTEEEALRTARVAAIGTDPMASLSRVRFAQYATALKTYSDAKARNLFERFRRNGTWQVPTLSVMQVMASVSDAAFIAARRERLKYMPPDFADRWDPARNAMLKLRLENAEVIAGEKQFYRKQLEIVGAMHRAGVPLLAGTDVPNPYVFPGSSLHDELALLVRAGLTPLDALRAATLNPARFLERASVMGTVERGKAADLVLLDANPLEDITNTRSIAAVILNGRLLHRTDLDRLLSDVAARHSPTPAALRR